MESKEESIEKKAEAFCKHLCYSKTGSQYSAFITGSRVGAQQKQAEFIKLIEGEIAFVAQKTNKLKQGIHPYDHGRYSAFKEFGDRLIGLLTKAKAL